MVPATEATPKSKSSKRSTQQRSRTQGARPQPRRRSLKSKPRPKQISVLTGARASGEVLRALQAPSNRLSRQPNKMVLGFTLPHLFPTPRISTVYSDFPTAIASPFLIRNIDWTTPTGSAERAIPRGSFVAAVSRNPLCSVIQYYEHPENMLSDYGLWFATPNSGSAFSSQFTFEVNLPTSAALPFTATYDTPLDPEFLQDRQWGASDYSHPHGYTYYAVDAGNRKCFYVSNTNSIIEFTQKHTVSTSDGTGSSLFRLLKWNNSTWDRTNDVVRLDVNDPVDTVAQITVPSPGYWAIELEVELNALTNAGQAFAFEVRLVAIGNQWGFSPINYIENVASSVGGIRVPAASIMLTQRTTNLAAGGQVVGVQLNNGESWESPIRDPDPYGQLASRSNSMTFKFETGIYGFLKPNDQPEFNIQRSFEIEDGEVVGYHNPISPPGSWLMVCAQVPFFTGSYAGGLAYLTVNYGVEFVTDNIWFSQLIPTSTNREFQRALEIMKTQQQWHENPLHFKDLVRSALSAGKTALTLAPTIAKMVSSFAPGAAPTAAVTEALSALGRAL